VPGGDPARNGPQALDVTLPAKKGIGLSRDRHELSLPADPLPADGNCPAFGMPSRRAPESLILVFVAVPNNAPTNR
jgi:hypothetical protein